MENRSEPLAAVIAGALGALALGIGFTLVRDVTTSSTFAFAFIVLTILVAELGGRAAAVVTALASAISLDFFLTEPYLALRVSRTDDLVAFLAMLASGLTVAAFGRRRVRWAAAAGRGRARLDALRTLANRIEAGAPPVAVLEEMRRAFGMGRIALRGEDERLLAVTPPVPEPSALPVPSLHLGSLSHLPPGEPPAGRRGLRVPPGGARIALASVPPMWLDIWAGGADDLDETGALALPVAASLLARLLGEAGAERARLEEAPPGATAAGAEGWRGGGAGLSNEIVRGSEEITPETALELERVLGAPADVWTRPRWARSAWVSPSASSVSARSSGRGSRRPGQARVSVAVPGIHALHVLAGDGDPPERRGPSPGEGGPRPGTRPAVRRVHRHPDDDPNRGRSGPFAPGAAAIDLARNGAMSRALGARAPFVSPGGTGVAYGLPAWHAVSYLGPKRTRAGRARAPT